MCCGTLLCKCVLSLVADCHSAGTWYQYTLPLALTCAGEAVFGLAPGCLGHTVYAPAQLVVAIPSSLSYEAAATTPTAYITAFAAFQQGGSMRAGATVSDNMIRCT